MWMLAQDFTYGWNRTPHSPSKISVCVYLYAAELACDNAANTQTHTENVEQQWVAFKMHLGCCCLYNVGFFVRLSRNISTNIIINLFGQRMMTKKAVHFALLNVIIEEMDFFSVLLLLSLWHGNQQQFTVWFCNLITKCLLHILRVLERPHWGFYRDLTRICTFRQEKKKWQIKCLHSSKQAFKQSLTSPFLWCRVSLCSRLCMRLFLLASRFAHTSINLGQPIY